MALPAKRWPLYAEEHRAEADACAEQSSKHLAASAKLLAEAIAAIKRGNPVQAELLITRAQLEEIVKTKQKDLTAADLDAGVRTIAGSARSMGIIVEGV